MGKEQGQRKPSYHKSQNKPRTVHTNTSDGTIKLFNAKKVQGVGVTKIKQQLRGVTRFLEGVESGKLTADEDKVNKAREDKKRLEAELESSNKINKQLAKNTRFDKVKFMEKMKIKRKIGQLTKTMTSLLIDEDEKPSAEEIKLRNDLADAREKLLYSSEFPPEEVYISILKECNPDALPLRAALMKMVLTKANYTRPTFRMSSAWKPGQKNDADADKFVNAEIDSDEEELEKKYNNEADDDDNDDFFA